MTLFFVSLSGCFSLSLYRSWLSDNILANDSLIFIMEVSSLGTWTGKNNLAKCQVSALSLSNSFSLSLFCLSSTITPSAYRRLRFTIDQNKQITKERLKATAKQQRKEKMMGESIDKLRIKVNINREINRKIKKETVKSGKEWKRIRGSDNSSCIPPFCI